MRKILVTGSNGLLGQKLVSKLKVHKEFQLIATSRGENRISDTSGYTYVSLDITNRDEVLTCFEKHQPEILIHTAAMTNVDACEDHKEECWQLNVGAVEHLHEASKKYNCHFIHLSTDFIFDGKAGPYKEEDQPNPISYYGESKLAAESILLKSNPNFAIVRTVLVYGLVEDMSRSNIVLWAKGALEKKQKINIVNDQFRTPTLVDDLADGCILIAEQSAQGIYHISGKDFMSIYQLVQRVAKYYQLDASYINKISSTTLNQRAKRPSKTGFILDKAIQILGYQPHSFEEGIAIMDKEF